MDEQYSTLVIKVISRLSMRIERGYLMLEEDKHESRQMNEEREREHTTFCSIFPAVAEIVANS